MQTNPKSISAARVLNLMLLITFVVTNMVPLTGVMVHKLASALFLLLCIVHAVVYRKKLKGKTVVLLAVVFIAFFTGVFGMIYDEVPLILALHKVISIGSVFFLAIHIFVFHRRLLRKK
ncbi:MAG: heme transporter CcmB [Oscillospiraceae bacterium]|nr:heme transporter CcmB [Oscillospiraceae bacterium]